MNNTHDNNRHDQSHCESSPGSFSPSWPPTLTPSQPTWVVSPAAVVHAHLYHSLLLLSPKGDTHFTVGTEGGRLSQPMHA